MPKALEGRLEHEADSKGLTGKRKAAYVYGTMRKTGWRPKRELTAGHAADALASRKG